MIKLLSSHNFARLTRWVPLVEQELLTITEHLSSPPVFTWSLVLCICFVDRCLSICTFSFSHCVVCSSSTNEFWLPPFGIFKTLVALFNGTNIIHMTTSVSRRLKKSWIMFNSRSSYSNVVRLVKWEGWQFTHMW